MAEKMKEMTPVAAPWEGAEAAVFQDRSTWTYDGRLWAQGEPDRVEWRHGYVPCLIVRGPAGALCGYVAVAPGHPWHGVDCSKIDAEAHGGLTYSAKCQAGGAICHVAKPGEPDDVWWLGFDCAHSGDLCPKYDGVGGSAFRDPFGIYRGLQYVRAQVESLAVQARAARLAGAVA